MGTVQAGRSNHRDTASRRRSPHEASSLARAFSLWRAPLCERCQSWEGGREGRVGTGGLGLNPWFQDAPRSWPPHSRRRARPLRNSGVGMAQETCCKCTSLAPRPPETWAGDLWDDSIVRISALGLASGCSGAAAGSLTAQTTARVSQAQPWEALCYPQGLTVAGAGGTAAQVTAVTWSQPWTPCQALCQALPCATTL